VNTSRTAVAHLVPGDLGIVETKDLFVIQDSLTGKSFPVEKHATEAEP